MEGDRHGPITLNEATELVAWSLAYLGYRYGGLGRMDILGKQPTMPDYRWQPLVLLS